MSGWRRARLTPRAPADHMGLWLDRYIEGNTELADSFKRAAEVTTPPVYRLRFKQWEAAITRLSRVSSVDSRFIACAEIKTEGRVVVGLGAESVHEVSLALQWLDGAPIIPGSALKGLAAHYARSHAELDEQSRMVLFGTPQATAYLTWFDAWYVPGSAQGDRPFVHDIMTVHHPRYYGTRGRERAPWDLDDPTPLPFLTVRGCFRVMVLGPDQKWAEFGLGVLTQALADWGVGAKTSSGYGRFSTVVNRPAGGPSEVTKQRAPSPADRLIAEIREIPRDRLRQELGGPIHRIERLPEGEQGPVIAALADRLRADNQWNWAQGRSWFTKLGLTPDR